MNLSELSVLRLDLEAVLPLTNDLLRVGDCLALGLGALYLGGGTCGGSLAFLRSAMRAHEAKRID
jgi:hypothetical protein